MLDIQVYKLLKATDSSFELSFSSKLQKGNLLALTGPSGSGKTSLLKILGGLMVPDHGKIIFNEHTWFNSQSKIHIPPQKRKIGFVFQDYGLFPHMTVFKNLKFALRNKKDYPIIEELLEVMELQPLKQRFPYQLSGGQQQRVALARALVGKPDLLLLDEPLAALDTAMRVSMQDYLQKIHNQFDLTTILVSHDLPEIFKLADQVIELNHGKITNQGTPQTVFTRQKSGKTLNLNGEILQMEKKETTFLITILVGEDIIKLPASHEEANNLEVGDHIILVTETFNPQIFKSNQG